MSTLRYPFLISDFDGTICDSNWYVAPEVKAAIAAHRAAGGQLHIATGRPFFGALETFLHDIQLSSICIVSGGARIYDPQKKQTVWSHTLGQDTLAALIAEIQKRPQLRFSLEQDDRVVMSRPERVAIAFGSNVLAVPISAWREQPTYKCVVSLNDSPETSKLYEIKEYVQQRAEFTCHESIGRSGPIVDITPPGGDKEKAARFLLNHLGASPDQAMFAGDGGNDVPLLSVGGWKAAASYAPPQLREKADVVIENDDHQMVARLIETYAYNE